MKKNGTVGESRIGILFDAGTFAETNAYLKRRDMSAGYEGVISGYGAIDGKLAFAFVQDSDREKGAFDALGAKKIAALYDTAIKSGAPVIGVFDSAGADVTEGSEVLSAYGTFLKCISDASGVIPQIAVISGTCTGMAAVAASMFDVVITVDSASTLSFHSAFRVGAEQAKRAAGYVSDLSCENEKKAFEAARHMVSMLPQNCEEGVEIDDITDDAERESTVGTVIETMASVADTASLLPLEEACEDGVHTALCKLGGVTVGLVGVDGALNPCGLSKMVWMQKLCAKYRIPVVTLLDCPGVDAEENEALCPALGAYADEVAQSDSARISVVTGSAYGVAFTLASKAMGADFVLATENAVIAPMAPDAAVAFLCNDRVTADKSRAEVEREWTQEHATARLAAENGDVDDLVLPAELRARLISAVYMLMRKAEL